MSHRDAKGTVTKAVRPQSPMVRVASPHPTTKKEIVRSQQQAAAALSAPRTVMVGGKVVKVTGTKLGFLGKSSNPTRSNDRTNEDKVPALIPPRPSTRIAPSPPTPPCTASLTHIVQSPSSSADISNTIDYFTSVTEQNRARVRQLKAEVSKMQQQLRSPVREHRRDLLHGEYDRSPKHGDKDIVSPRPAAASSPFDYGFGFDATVISANPPHNSDYYNSDFQYSSSSIYDNGYDFDSVYHEPFQKNSRRNPFDDVVVAAVTEEDLVDASELQSGFEIYDAESGDRIPLDDSIASINPFDNQARMSDEGEDSTRFEFDLFLRMAKVDEVDEDEELERMLQVELDEQARVRAAEEERIRAIEDQQAKLARLAERARHALAEEKACLAKQAADEQVRLASIAERAEQALREERARLALQEEELRRQVAVEEGKSRAALEEEKRRLALLAEQLEGERRRLDKERARHDIEELERENRVRLGKLEAADFARQEQERRRQAAEAADAARERDAVARALAEEQERQTREKQRAELLAKLLAEEEQERLRKRELAEREEEEHARALAREAEDVHRRLVAEKAKLQLLEEEWLRKKAMVDDEDLRRAARVVQQQPVQQEVTLAQQETTSALEPHAEKARDVVLCDSSAQCDSPVEPPLASRQHTKKKLVSFSSRDDFSRAHSDIDSDSTELCEDSISGYLGGVEDSGHIYFEHFDSDSESSCSDHELSFGSRRHVHQKDFDSPQRLASPSDVSSTDDNDVEMVHEVAYSSDDNK